MNNSLMDLARRRAWVWLPVFLAAVLINPFLHAGHPWKGRRESLDSWREYGTELALGFALIFWWCALLSLACIIKILAVRAGQ